MILICFRVLVLLLNRVLLLRSDLLKYFKRDNVPCLPQVSSGFYPLSLLAAFVPFNQLSSSPCLLDLSLKSIHSHIHREQLTVPDCFPLPFPISAQSF